MEMFKALKGLINKQINIYHKSSELEFTVQVLSPEGYNALANVGKYNPLYNEVPSQLSIEIEKDILFLAYGVVEFEKDVEIATQFYNNPTFSEDTFNLIESVRALNPGEEQRQEDVILTLAFNLTELKLFYIAKNNGLIREILKEITGEEDVIIGLSRASEILESIDFFETSAKSLNLTPEYIALAEAKIILLNRGIDELHVTHLPDYPKETARTPQNVYVNET